MRKEKNILKKVSCFITLFMAVAVLLSSCSMLSPGETTLVSPVAEIPGKSDSSEYYYSELTKDEKTAYNSMVFYTERYSALIEVPNLSVESLTKVFKAVLNENPLLFNLSRVCTSQSADGVYYFKPGYILEEKEYWEKREELEAKAESIIADMKPDMSEYEKELYVHDIIVNSCKYSDTENPLESSAYGALVTGLASCEGYAKSGKMLLDMLGIENYLMPGSANNDEQKTQSHMWNIVKINGKYYHLDMTWDDPVDQNKTDMSRHTYMNLSDEEIKKTHSQFINRNQCLSMDMNYFVMEKLLFSEYGGEFRTKLAEILSEAINADKGKIEFRFKDKKTYDAASKGLFDEQQVFRVLNIAKLDTDKKLNTKNISKVLNDDFRIIEIIYKLDN